MEHQDVTGNEVNAAVNLSALLFTLPKETMHWYRLLRVVLRFGARQ